MSPSLSVRSAKILVLHADPETMRTLAGPLARSGFDVHFASGGREALKMLRDTPVEIVLSGTEFEDMDGIEFARAAREGGEVPIVFVTRRSDVFSVTRAFSAGASDYLALPFEDEELLARVRTHVELARSRSELERRYEELDAAYRRLEVISRTDLLTGVPNRKDMTERLEREISRGRRSGSTFSVVMADIDALEDINARYGRACGDYLLVTVSAAMRGLLRSHDTMARWEEDTFFFLLPDTSLLGAFSLAEKIRSQLADQTFEYEGETVSVTLSFGVAESESTMRWDALVGEADKALWLSKMYGKNRVMKIQS